MKNSWLKRSLTEDEPVDKYSFLPALISWEGSSEVRSSRLLRRSQWDGVQLAHSRTSSGTRFGLAVPPSHFTLLGPQLLFSGITSTNNKLPASPASGSASGGTRLGQHSL